MVVIGSLLPEDLMKNEALEPWSLCERTGALGLLQRVREAFI